VAPGWQQDAKPQAGPQQAIGRFIAPADEMLTDVQHDQDLARADRRATPVTAKLRVPWIWCVPVPHANCENIRGLSRATIEAAIGL
jgi:hypothetical protein